MTADARRALAARLEHWLVVLALVFCAGCASKLPPHVWIPIEHLEAADIFWWIGPPQQCTLRLMWARGKDDIVSMTLPMPLPTCIEWLKADGYDVKDVQIPVLKVTP